MFLSFQLLCPRFHITLLNLGLLWWLKAIKTPKLNTIWLKLIARILNMLIGLKGNNYYSKVFKRVYYKLSKSTFWVVINGSVLSLGGQNLLWVTVSVCNVWHRSLYSKMGMVILGSAEVEGSNAAGITGGVLLVAWQAKGIPSCMDSVDALLAAGISTGYGSSDFCGCGSSGCSALYAVILVHLSRVNTSRHIRLHSS